MKQTLTESLRAGEIAIVIPVVLFDGNNLPEKEDEKEIRSALTGVNPYLTQGMSALQVIEYGKAMGNGPVGLGLNIVNNPLLLYSLNNRILHYLVREKVNQRDIRKLWTKEFPPLNPDLISVFQWDSKELKCIQDKKGLIRDNCFNDRMNDIMTAFHSLLNFYDFLTVGRK